MKTIHNLRYIQAEFSQNNDLVELRPCQSPFRNLDDRLNLPFAQQIKLCFPEFAVFILLIVLRLDLSKGPAQIYH